MISIFIVFALINFSALGIGTLLMGTPRKNEWYQRVNKAPWTPPNWVFSVAWTTIMICFTFFLFIAARNESVQELQIVYIILGIQWFLNVVWNPVFFRWHKSALGLLLIIALEGVVGWFMVWGFTHVGAAGALLLPYFLWLLIAASLNGYVLFKNRNTPPLAHSMQ